MKSKIDLVDLFNRALVFLNLKDNIGNLSITNLAVYIVLVKIYMSPATSLTEAGTLLIALANYAHKRVVNQNSQVIEEDPLKPQIDEMQKKIEEVTSQVSTMAIQNGIKKLN